MLTRRQIRYFLAVIDTGQISAAARSLNVSQSAVTLSIQDMEAKVGTVLFERLPTGLRLSKAGRQFQHHALEIEGAFEAAMKSVTGGGEPVAGTIRLGMSWALSSYFAIPVIEQFSRRNPQIDIQLTEEPRRILEEALLGSGPIDFRRVA